MDRDLRTLLTPLLSPAPPPPHTHTLLSPSKLNNNTNGGKLVHVYRSGNGSHPSFGELALMYSTPRAASIIADSPGQLWALHRNVFRKVLMRRSGRKVRNWSLGVGER